MAEGDPPVSNWIILEPGVPKRLHFFAHGRVQRQIRDAITGVEKMVDSLYFNVDFEDGKPVSKSYSVVSQRLAAELAPYLPGKRYEHFAFTIVKGAPGMVAPRVLSVEPWSAPRS